MKLLTYDQTREALTSIGKKRERIAMMTVYACMARESEIFRTKKKPQALTSEDITVTPTRLYFTVLTSKIHKLRRVPISRIREPWLTEGIISYADHISGELFPYSTRWAEKVFLKYFPDFSGKSMETTYHTIHLLRGWRATHYRQGKITGQPVDWGIVCRLGGWTSPTVPARAYDFSVTEDYEEELFKGDI